MWVVVPVHVLARERKPAPACAMISRILKKSRVETQAGRAVSAGRPWRVAYGPFTMDKAIPNARFCRRGLASANANSFRKHPSWERTGFANRAPIKNARARKINSIEILHSRRSSVKGLLLRDLGKGAAEPPEGLSPSGLFSFSWNEGDEGWNAAYRMFKLLAI